MTEPMNTCDGLGELTQPSFSVDLPENIPALRTFYLYLSAGCNLHCRHCWITPTFVKGKPVPGECVNIDLLKDAVSEAKPMGLSAAKLTGGEPLLHPQFIQIVDFLSEEKLNLTMETNGTLIDHDIAVHLKEKTTLSHVSVSIDSPNAKQHDRFRGVPGAFKAAIRGVEYLVMAGFRPQIIMSVFRENLDQIEDLIELAVKLGAGSVKFNPVTASGRGAEIHEKGLGLDIGDVLALSHHIRGPLQDRFPVYLCTMLPPALLTLKELIRLCGTGGGTCGVRHILGVLGNGEMALCGIGRNIPELCFGRLGVDSIRDIWIANPVLQKLRHDLDGNFPGLCGDCLHAGRCLTHCVAMNYEATGELVNVSPLCAEAERIGLFPKTRCVSWMDGDC